MQSTATNTIESLVLQDLEALKNQYQESIATPTEPVKKKLKVLLMSDDVRSHTGVGTMSLEIIKSTAHRIDWIQMACGAGDSRQIIDFSQAIREASGVEDATCKLYPVSHFGSPLELREIISLESPDAIVHFTDPHRWVWVYEMENEIRKKCPLLFYTIWDELPDPKFNEPFYRSCDALMCISKQTYGIIKRILPDYVPDAIRYIPHGADDAVFTPPKDLKERKDLKNKMGYGKYNFIAFVNVRNIQRKRLPDLFRAWQLFTDSLDAEKRERILLLLHTDVKDIGGFDLDKVIEDNFSDLNIQFTNNRGCSKSTLRKYYVISNLTINIASSEGFGLSTLESMLCGTKILVNVTGGLQDQAGFKNEYTNEYLTAEDYVSLKTNSNGTFKSHGMWAEVAYPSAKYLQGGSELSPYIYDAPANIDEVCAGILNVYNKADSEIYTEGLAGRLFALESMTSSIMGNSIADCVDWAVAKHKTPKNYRTLTIK